MEFLKLLMWFGVNVCVPFLAPIALLPFLGLRKRFKGRTRKIVMRALQEGQLCWSVIAMCVAACFEVSGEVRGFSDSPGLNLVVGRVAIIWHVAMIIAAALVVMLGAEDAEDEIIAIEAQKIEKGKRSAAVNQAATAVIDAPSSIMVSSIYMAIITAVSVTATHIWAR